MAARDLGRQELIELYRFLYGRQPEMPSDYRVAQQTFFECYQALFADSIRVGGDSASSWLDRAAMRVSSDVSKRWRQQKKQKVLGSVARSTFARNWKQTLVSALGEEYS
jgi:hypothetical protein